MTSSKFSVRPPPFKIPAVCKKKTAGPPPPPPGNPLPQDPLEGQYAIHGTYFGTPYDRDGPLLLDQITATHWQSLTPAPPNGELMFFDWNEVVPQYSGGLYIYQGGVLRVVFNKLTTSYSWVDDFNTGEFDWTNVWFAGTKTGRFLNPT